jgi:hypothetical protein
MVSDAILKSFSKQENNSICHGKVAIFSISEHGNMSASAFGLRWSHESDPKALEHFSDYRISAQGASQATLPIF